MSVAAEQKRGGKTADTGSNDDDIRHGAPSGGARGRPYRTPSGRGRQVRLCPAGELVQGGAQGGAALGELVDRSDGRSRQNAPRDQARVLELGEPGGEHSLGDSRDRRRELAEARRALEKRPDDDAGPALTQEG